MKIRALLTFVLIAINANCASGKETIYLKKDDAGSVLFSDNSVMTLVDSIMLPNVDFSGESLEICLRFLQSRTEDYLQQTVEKDLKVPFVAEKNIKDFKVNYKAANVKLKRVLVELAQSSGSEIVISNGSVVFMKKK